MHRDAQHILPQGLGGQALVIALQGFTAHQVHNEFEPHFATHRRLAKNGADVQKANAAHFQQVLQQIGAARFDGGLVDAVQVHRIVGHQAIAARDQLQAQLAFAQTRLARDQHAHAQNVHEHTVHGGAVGKVLGQISPQHIDHKGRGLLGGKHRNLRPLAHGQQGLGRGLTVGQHQHWRLQRHDACNASRAVVRRAIRQVSDFARPQNLDAVGMDVIEVTHQVGAGAGLAHGDLVKAPLRGAQSGLPLPLELLAVVLKQDIGADDGGFHRLQAVEKGFRRFGPIATGQSTGASPLGLCCF